MNIDRCNTYPFFPKLVLKIFIFLVLLCSCQLGKGQVFLNLNEEEILEFYTLDSNYIIRENSTLILQWDSLNSGTIEFKFKDGICNEYQLEFTCRECYDLYVFELLEDYYSDWFPYNDSVYFLKNGNWGKQLELGKKMEYYVPRMVVKFDSLEKKCMSAVVTGEYMNKEEYKMTFTKSDHFKVRKRELKGIWKIQPNVEYPTEIESIEIGGRFAYINFVDFEYEEYLVKWIADNAFQLWYLDDETNGYKIYLTGEVNSLSESELDVWFYDGVTKYHQTFKKTIPKK